MPHPKNVTGPTMQKQTEDLPEHENDEDMMKLLYEKYGIEDD
jgi:hypothetical protein